MVFVLDKHKKPLMPCSPKRARLLLARRRAVVHRLSPFVIRLKDRRVEESTLQPAILKVDPGSKTSGMALVREEATGEGPLHYALHLARRCATGEPRCIRPCSSARVGNVLACHDCNLAKGNLTAAEFGHPEVEAQAKVPLRHAAAVNATQLGAGARA